MACAFVVEALVLPRELVPVHNAALDEEGPPEIIGVTGKERRVLSRSKMARPC